MAGDTSVCFLSSALFVLFSKACGHAVLIQSSFTQGTQKDLLLVLVFITSLQGELTSDFGRD